MLDIRTRYSPKKGTVVYLYVKHKGVNEKNGKVAYRFKMLSSFSLEAGCTPKILALLDDEERFQLKNWLAENEFAKKLNTPLEEMDSMILRVPKKLKAALIELSKESERSGIEFIPHQTILNSLLESGQFTKRKLNQLGKINANSVQRIKN